VLALDDGKRREDVADVVLIGDAVEDELKRVEPRAGDAAPSRSKCFTEPRLHRVFDAALNYLRR
ncbi:MAG: hypothetical protein ACXW3R_09215, partial [Rhodoplanes sp.]